MKTSYFVMAGDGKPSLLGAEENTGIEQVLFPDVVYNQHPITITKFFKNQPCHRWKVETVTHPSNEDIYIFLSERSDNSSIEFLQQTLKSDRSVLSKLSKGTFVEVEFGYLPSVKKSCGSTRSNKRYPDQIQNGEMHKRRLAVVIRADATTLQVIPVTSQQKAESDRSSFTISADSLKDLADYSDSSIQSTAICGMIQTVSHRRVFPPLARSIKARKPIRHKHYPNRLTRSDLQLLNMSLSSSVGLSDYQELVNRASSAAGESHQLRSELARLRSELDSKNVELEQLNGYERQFRGLLETMIQWKMHIDPSLDKESAQNSILAEAAENLEILDLLESER